jgi:hypothetical protein
MTYQNDPEMNRRGAIRFNNRLIWVGGIVAALLLAVLLYSFSLNNTTAAKNSAPSTTTGQGIAKTPLTSTSPVGARIE